MVEHAGAKSVVIRSTDTDVVVLAVSYFDHLQKFGLEELWLQYGSGVKRRYISVNEIFKELGKDKSVALRGFHAFTGCDYVSFFGSKGNRTAWAAWTDDETTQAFINMSIPSQCQPESLLPALEKFIVKMYGVNSDKVLSFNRLSFI